MVSELGQYSVDMMDRAVFLSIVVIVLIGIQRYLMLMHIIIQLKYLRTNTSRPRIAYFRIFIVVYLPRLRFHEEEKRSSI